MPIKISKAYFVLNISDTYREECKKKFPNSKERITHFRELRTILKDQKLNKACRTQAEADYLLTQIDPFLTDVFTVDEQISIGF